MTDWQAIKKEYITTDASYEKLASRYGINKTTIAKRAGAEHWVQLRKDHANKVLSKATDKIARKQANDYARVNALADVLLDKLEQAASELDLLTIHRKVRDETETGFEEKSYNEVKPGGTVDQKALRSLASALKDLKEVKDLKSCLDQEEQEARIEAQKNRAASEETGGVTLTINGGDQYAN